MRLPDCWIRSGLRDAWSSRVNSLKLSRLGHSSHVSGEEEKHIQNANSGVRLKFISVQTNIYSSDTDDLFQQLYMCLKWSVSFTYYPLTQPRYLQLHHCRPAPLALARVTRLVVLCPLSPPVTILHYCNVTTLRRTSSLSRHLPPSFCLSELTNGQTSSFNCYS